jgi:hypothetical protein
MATTFNILLFLAVVALALNVGCGIFDPTNTQCSTPMNDILTGSSNAVSTQLYLLLGILAAIGIGGAILFGTLSFPNPYAIFAGITLAIVQLAVIPSAGFTLLGIPEPFSTFLSGIFVLAWYFAAYNSFKGGEA